MSLIEEALKKQQEELNEGRSQAAHPPAASPGSSDSSTPTPSQAAIPPPVPLVVKEPVFRPQWIMPIISGVLICLLLIGVVFWLFSGGIIKMTKPEPAPAVFKAIPTPAVKAAQEKPVAPATVRPPQTASTIAPAPSPAAKAAAQPPVPVPAPEIVSVAPPKPVVTEARTPPPSAPAVTASALVNTPSPPVPAPPVASAPPAPATPTPQAAAVEVTEAVAWPSLTVTGIIEGRGANKGAALINNQLTMVGDSIDGAKLLAVMQHGVKMSFEGESRVIKVGGSTIDR